MGASLKDFGNDRIAATAAGATYYALLALFPAISAFVSLFGLVADVGAVQREVLSLEGLLPGGAVTVVAGELTRLIHASHSALSLAFVFSLVVSIWSASAGMKAVIDGLNVAYEVRERRGFIRLTLISLAFTLGGLLLVAAAAALFVLAPRAIGAIGLDGEALANWFRWPLIAVVATLTFSVLYRFAPSRPEARWRWITPGGVTAALLWLIMSALFTWYVANFGHYDKTYGSLGAIVGCLTWIWLSLMVVLFGAELNNEIERQAGKSSQVPH